MLYIGIRAGLILGNESPVVDRWQFPRAQRVGENYPPIKIRANTVEGMGCASFGRALLVMPSIALCRFQW